MSYYIINNRDPNNKFELFKSLFRTCPHGVPIGPLDAYGVPEDAEVTSQYCAKCSPGHGLEDGQELALEGESDPENKQA